MDFEFTGEETPEQLEKMLEGLGDVDIDGHEQDGVTEAATENHADEAAQTQTGDNTAAPTPDASAEQTQDVKEPEAKGVLTRDGKHVIPYEVLEAERSGKQRAEQEAALLRGQIAEEKRLVELLTSQIHQAGMKPAPLPEAEYVLTQDDDTPVPLEEAYVNPLVEWMLFRAFSKDAAGGAESGLAAQHYQSFVEQLGIKQGADSALSARKKVFNGGGV
ncbi:DUF6682 family protein [Escherichia coli]